MSGGPNNLFKGWGGVGQPPRREDFISGGGWRAGHPFSEGETPQVTPSSFNEAGFLDATSDYERRQALQAKRQEAMEKLMAYGQKDLSPGAPSIQRYGPVSKSEFNIIDMVPEESIYDRQEKKKRKLFTEELF